MGPAEGRGLGGVGDQLVTSGPDDRAGDGNWRRVQPRARKSIGDQRSRGTLFIRCGGEAGQGRGAGGNITDPRQD